MKEENMRARWILFFLTIGFTINFTLQEAFAGPLVCRATLGTTFPDLTRGAREDLINLSGENVQNLNQFYRYSTTFRSLLPLFYASSLIDRLDKNSPSTGLLIFRHRISPLTTELLSEDAMRVDLKSFDGPFADIIQDRISKILSYELKSFNSDFGLDPKYIMKLVKSSDRFQMKKHSSALEIKTANHLYRKLGISKSNPEARDIIEALSHDLVYRELGLPHSSKPRVLLDDGQEKVTAVVVSLSPFHVKYNRNSSVPIDVRFLDSPLYVFSQTFKPVLNESYHLPIFKVTELGSRPSSLIEVSAKKSQKVAINQRRSSPDYDSMWRDGKLTGIVMIGSDMSESRYLAKEYREYYEIEGYKFDSPFSVKDSRKFIADLVQSGEADYLAKEDNGSDRISLTAKVEVGQKSIKGKGQLVIYLINGSSEVSRGSESQPVVAASDWRGMLQARRLNAKAGDIIYINTKCSSFCTSITQTALDSRFDYIAPEGLADTFTNEGSTALLHILRGLQRGWSYAEIKAQIQKNRGSDEYNEYVFPNDRQWKQPTANLHRVLFEVNFLTPDGKSTTPEQFYEVSQ